MVRKKYRNMKKVTICKNGQKISQYSPHEESDKCESNFMYLGHQDNIFQMTLQSFQTNDHLSLRNSGKYKQNGNLTEVENTEFALVEKGVGV